MVHCIPCCYQCPICVKNIKIGYYTAHKEKCKEKNKFKDMRDIYSIFKNIFNNGGKNG